MILPDANLLLYAYDATSTHHSAAKNWLEETICEQIPVRLAWVVLTAFLRITTNPRAVREPLSEEAACSIVGSLLEQPSVAIINPGPQHWAIFSRLVEAAGARGPLVMDAHLAALAIEHGAILCTHDRDFMRFAGLRSEYPLVVP